MILNKINTHILNELQRLHISLDHLYLIERIYMNDDILNDTPLVLWQTLERKGFTNQFRTLTDKGISLYQLLNDPTFFSSETNIKKELKKVKEALNEDFKKWWDLYPTTAFWTDENGRKFESSRRVRGSNDTECQVKFLEAISEGYTVDELITALLFQIDQIKKESKRTGQNKMIYMQGALVYLNQKTYKDYIFIIRKNNWKPIEDSISNVTVSSKDLF